MPTATAEELATSSGLDKTHHGSAVRSVLHMGLASNPAARRIDDVRRIDREPV
ncbi:MAG: hypothetical protein AAFO75_04630 [Pseudomonadota bacterium]